ncbi:alpha-ketoglutarate decarboxylase [Streptomyces bikiniensis]|uniref:alpha-ketoglutarate decarboxylase n=1 Tax=Streptomyces bikiniensis TaxID=1896 RepID=UPI0004BF9C96|nr:alpha-ketoglutarate decarboxylase [Streptomyces bikiniensis]
MSASDQGPPATGAAKTAEAAKGPEVPDAAGESEAPVTEKPAAGEPSGEPAGEPSGEPAGEPSGEPAGEPEEDEHEEEGDDEGGGLTPRQARRLRIAAASVLLVALAVVLVVRLASRTSVLVVGVYGLAMILCGIVIELSRNGRTRLGTWLLAGGLLTALALDWLVLP